MTDDEIIEIAQELGWNVEHAETNRMLILFAHYIQQLTTEQQNEVQVSPR